MRFANALTLPTGRITGTRSGIGRLRADRGCLRLEALMSVIGIQTHSGLPDALQSYRSNFDLMSLILVKQQFDPDQTAIDVRPISNHCLTTIKLLFDHYQISV
jgi:hypothetical protein